MIISIDETDLLKVLDALENGTNHFLLRDQANAKLHLAPAVRYSPITSQMQSAYQRLDTIMIEARNASDGESIGSGE